VLKRLSIVFALVVGLALVGVVPASADQATTDDTVSQALPATAGEVMVQTCINRRPVGWWLEGGYPNPHGCERCAIDGLGWELTGNYRAWCSREANGAILWLFCVVCRKGDEAGPASRVVALPGLTPTSGGPVSSGR
jgi:hypothetical protein